MAASRRRAAALTGPSYRPTMPPALRAPRRLRLRLRLPEIDDVALLVQFHRHARAFLDRLGLHFHALEWKDSFPFRGPQFDLLLGLAGIDQLAGHQAVRALLVLRRPMVIDDEIVLIEPERHLIADSRVLGRRFRADRIVSHRG